jgi:hypothetical protein
MPYGSWHPTTVRNAREWSKITRNKIKYIVNIENKLIFMNIAKKMIENC